MSHDLLLGFRELPKELDSKLLELGFRKQTFDHKNPLAEQYTIKYYIFHKKGQSASNIQFSYVTPTDKQKLWQHLKEDIKANANLTLRRGRNEFNTQKQLEIAKHLRDHYNAVLVDMDNNLIRD